MMPAVKAILQKYPYVPVLTEMQGVFMILTGAACLGAGSVLKVNEYFTGKKVSTFICDDFGKFNIDIGKGGLKHGCKQIAPGTIAMLVMYAIYQSHHPM